MFQAKRAKTKPSKADKAQSQPIKNARVTALNSYLVYVLFENLYDVGHAEVQQVVPPSEFQHVVWA